MRAIATILFLGLVAAGPAAAQPQAKEKKASAKQASAQKGAGPDRADSPGRAPSAPRARPGFGLGSMAAAAASAAAEGALEARRLDLTPERQMGGMKPAADRRGSERHPGLTLPDDADWRVQAVEVGAMAAAFTALVALCGDGGCLLPELFGIGGKDAVGLAPDLEIREQPSLRDPY